ncbi:MAG TPA: glycosyltransferase family 4 protein [Pirellulales bacterium]|nr:glycosyltransferase family 4 protein [Pirellulales bacterium]
MESKPSSPRKPTNRPRKVLHVLNSAGGGAAMSTIAVMESHSQQGIAACAVCHDAGSSEERDRLREATRGAVLFTPLYWWNRKIRAALWRRPLIELHQLLQTGWMRGSSRKVADFAHRQQVDLIHTNTMLTPEGGVAARRLGLPHIWHLRELIGAGQPFRIAKSKPGLSRFIKQHASLVIANSQIAADKARGWIPAAMLRVVPNGIDVQAFVPRQDKVRKGPLIVAMVASLTSRTKRHSIFVEAAARLRETAGVEFRIYGHDSTAGGTRPGDRYAEEIHRLIRERGLADRFRWPGHVADPAQIMAEIDILVHPADNESFGRTPVEAMAAGLPVVGVRGGGVGETVLDGVTGLLVPAGESATMAAAIMRLVNDPPLRTRLGVASRQRAESHYSLETCAAGILQAYEEAVKCPVGRPALSLASHPSPLAP